MVDASAASMAGVGLLSAGLFGFLGSAHCAGMCGPLVGLYTKQLQGQTARQIQRQHLLYNLGRLLMYTHLGVLFGAMGFLVGLLPWATGVMGVVTGVFIAVIGLSLLGVGRAARMLNYAMSSLTQKLATGWTWHGRVARSPGIIMLGAFHAFLPCPLLYVMFTSAIALRDPVHAGTLLFGFGLGTIPMMWAIAVLSERVRIPRWLRLGWWYGIGVTAWGGVLVFEGIHALKAF